MLKHQHPQFLTSFSLKITALVTMLIDHVGLLFFPQYPVFRMIGRLSFPIYCFLLSQGFIYTKNRGKYLLRLLIFGFISAVPHTLFIYSEPFWKVGQSINVMFELAAGFVVLILLDKAKKRRNSKSLNAAVKLTCLTLCLFVSLAAQLLNFSYGAYGILLIAGFYLFSENARLQCLNLFVCTFLYYLVFSVELQLYAVFVCPLFICFNGKKGKPLFKYIFYFFYPLHLLVLYLIKTIL